MDLREYFKDRRDIDGGEFLVTSEQIGEAFFQIYGPTYAAKGWSVYPQERTGRRMPARVDGEVIAWSKFQEERAPAELVERWALHAPTANVACIMGPCSGNAVAIDIDVMHERLSLDIQGLAQRVFGDTEYHRIGKLPKWMMFYRLTEKASFNKRTIRLAVPGDEKTDSGHMVEILAKNSTVTFNGRHHETGGRFQWSEPPLYISPDELPVITEEMLEEFERGLAELCTIFKPARGSYTIDFSTLPTTTGSIRRVNPRNHKDWAVDKTTGLVTDGREKYLTRICFELIRANPYQRYEKEVIDQLARVAFETFTAGADRSGRWNDGFILKEAGSRLNRNAREMEGNRITPNWPVINAGRTEGSIVEEAPASNTVFSRMEKTGLEWITAGKAFEPKHNRIKAETANPEGLLARQEVRKLLPIRDGLSKDVRRKCEKAADAVWRSIIAKQHRDLLRILKAPTGSGKTTRVMKRLLARIRARPHTLKAGERIIFIVPTYENAQELLTVAGEDGAEILTHESEIPTGPAEPGKPRVALWVGKKHTDCPNKGLMDEMEKLDIAPGRVCQAGKIKCKFWLDGLCKYHRQSEIYETAQIVICVVSYLTMASVPEALSKGAVALIVDEDPVLKIVREFDLQLADLKGWRLGTTTKKLTDLGYADEHVVLDMRQEAVRVVTESILAGRDPAADLLSHKWSSKEHKLVDVPGEHLMVAAKAVIEQARAAELQIEPNMMPATVSAILVQHDKNPKWHGMTAERHFWRVIADRLEAVKKDHISQSLWRSAVRSAWALASDNVPEAVRSEAVRKAEAMEKSQPNAIARGKTDARLQPRGHVNEAGKRIYTHIRVSRRIDSKFKDMPALLLDASAQVELVKKVFGRRVEEIPVHAPPHLRIAVCLDEVFSDASLCPHAEDDFEQSQKKEKRVRKIRLMIAKTCDQFAPDRVLLVASQNVLEVLLNAWKVPANLDWMYYGNLRGLDGAKHHAAIVTVGRSQMPPEAVDAKAAAITYDDEEPETPFDALGTGRTADGSPIRRPSPKRTLHLRNGHNVSINVPMMPTPRGRQIETAWREEELRQAVGRLRTIHRGGDTIPPVWIAIGGSAIPEDFVVDEIFSLDDAIKDAGVADERRKAGLIVSDKPALKLAKKRAETDHEHAALELRIAAEREAGEEINTAEVARLAKAAERIKWRLEFWPRLGWLPAGWRDLVSSPERLAEIGIDPVAVDEEAYAAATTAHEAEQHTQDQEVALVDAVAAPEMSTPEVQVSEAEWMPEKWTPETDAEAQAMWAADEEYESLW